MDLTKHFTEGSPAEAIVAAAKRTVSTVGNIEKHALDNFTEITERMAEISLNPTAHHAAISTVHGIFSVAFREKSLAHEHRFTKAEIDCMRTLEKALKIPERDTVGGQGYSTSAIMARHNVSEGGKYEIDNDCTSMSSDRLGPHRITVSVSHTL